jgi:hypothetical protein
VQVDPVKQGSADLSEVALDDAAGAAALPCRAAIKAARAPVQITTDTAGATKAMVGSVPGGNDVPVRFVLQTTSALTSLANDVLSGFSRVMPVSSAELRLWG